MSTTEIALDRACREELIKLIDILRALGVDVRLKSSNSISEIELPVLIPSLVLAKTLLQHYPYIMSRFGSKIKKIVYEPEDSFMKIIASEPSLGEVEISIVQDRGYSDIERLARVSARICLHISAYAGLPLISRVLFPLHQPVSRGAPYPRFIRGTGTSRPRTHPSVREPHGTLEMLSNKI